MALSFFLHASDQILPLIALFPVIVTALMLLLCLLCFHGQALHTTRSMLHTCALSAFLWERLFHKVGGSSVLERGMLATLGESSGNEALALGLGLVLTMVCPLCHVSSS